MPHDDVEKVLVACARRCATVPRSIENSPWGYGSIEVTSAIAS